MAIQRLFTRGLPLALMCLFSVLAGEPDAPIVPPPPAGTASPDAPLPKAEVLPKVDWSAAKQTFDETRGAVILSGSAWVRYSGTKLEADNIVFFRVARQVYAEGNIRLRAGESEIAAQVAFIDISTDSGYLVDAVVRVSAPPEALKGFMKTEEQQRKDDEEKRVRDDMGKSSPSFLRTRDPYGVYLDPVNDPQARTNLVFRAERIIKHSNLRFTAEDAFVTPDDMVHPMYGVQAGEIEFLLREVATDPKNPEKMELKPNKIVARRARINILGLSLFPFPTITYDLVKRNPFFSLDYGNSKRWGPFALTRLGYDLGKGEDKIFDPTHVYLDLDERFKRGPAAGFELNWETGRRPPPCEGEKLKFERGHGHIRVYSIYEVQTGRKDDIERARRNLERRVQPKFDGFHRRVFDANLLFIKRRKLQNAGPPSFTLDTHRDEVRGNIDFAHHQPLKRFAGIDNLLLDLKFREQTDRDFNVEYFPANYKRESQPEALVSLRKPGDNYSVELLYRGNPQDFDGSPPRSPVDYGTFSGYEPALTYSLTPTHLRWGFYLDGELQAARLTRQFDRDIYDQSGFDANRLYGKVDLSRPIRWGPINFVPHVGTQQAAYDNSINGDSIVQGAMTYGIDISSRIYGTFADFDNDALGVKGLRHIIEPRFSYNAVGHTNESAFKVLDFDEVDDLQSLDKTTFALDQVFQTRRPGKEGEGTRTVDIAGLEMAIDSFPHGGDRRRILGGDAFDIYRADAFFRVLDVARIHAGIGYNFADGDVEQARAGFSIDPHTRWKLHFEERFAYTDRSRRITGSDQTRVRLDYKLSERWGLSVERIMERRQSQLQRRGKQIERVAITRHYGSLDATFTYSYDRTISDSSVYFSLRPAITYRNLVVPTQDLLVASGEVNGDEDTPEEKNYNPFELMKRKNRPGNKAGKKNAPEPLPPLLPRDQDTPTPRQPSAPAPADKRADQFKEPGESKSAGVFKDPRSAPSAAKKSRLDADDWTTPPATPASTR